MGKEVIRTILFLVMALLAILAILILYNAPSEIVEGEGKIYVGKSVEECSRIRFICAEGKEYFSDEKGCGCKNAEIEVCTADAKLCPDGSYVARNPELDCDFNPCPGEEILIHIEESEFVEEFIKAESISDDKLRSCNTDEDCVVITDGCCSCSSGGAMTAFNKKYLDSWTTFSTSACKEISCLGVISNHASCFSTPKCVNNQCRLVPKKEVICSPSWSLIYENCKLVSFYTPNRTSEFRRDLGLSCSEVFEMCGEIPEQHFCQPEQRNAGACITLYQPVCGWFDSGRVQCIREPCAQTFSNSCFACMDENVLYWMEGECAA